MCKQHVITEARVRASGNGVQDLVERHHVEVARDVRRRRTEEEPARARRGSSLAFPLERGLEQGARHRKQWIRLLDVERLAELAPEERVVAERDRVRVA